MVEIREKVVEKGGRNLLSKLVHVKNDKETIAAWKLDLNGVLQVFTVRSITLTWLSLIVPSRPNWS